MLGWELMIVLRDEDDQYKKAYANPGILTLASFEAGINTYSN